jgi:hypothetical protein
MIQVAERLDREGMTVLLSSKVPDNFQLSLRDLDGVCCPAPMPAVGPSPIPPSIFIRMGNELVQRSEDRDREIANATLLNDLGR